ncbi:MAG: hypothetical protein ACLSD6_02865 [Clostridium sp.]
MVRFLNKRSNLYEYIFRLAFVTGAQCNELVSVCAAMPDGTGTATFAKTFPSRAFDVGIAEEHAVTLRQDFAAGGMRPVVSLYSTFCDSAYDQMIHDVSYWQSAGYFYSRPKRHCRK